MRRTHSPPTPRTSDILRTSFGILECRNLDECTALFSSHQREALDRLFGKISYLLRCVARTRPLLRLKMFSREIGSCSNSTRYSV